MNIISCGTKSETVVHSVSNPANSGGASTSASDVEAPEESLEDEEQQEEESNDKKDTTSAKETVEQQPEPELEPIPAPAPAPAPAPTPTPKPQKTVSSVEYYTPTMENYLRDAVYMNRIDQLIEKTAGNIHNSKFFKRLARTVGWVESHWRHYTKKGDKVVVITGDDKKSYGMFQIYSKYHGVHAGILDNTKYALTLLKKVYEKAKKTDCPSGSNAGSAQIALLRRIYAQYNGGIVNRCRNNHIHDDRFEKHFYNRPWESYLD